MSSIPFREFGVVELRRYVTRPGARDTLIELFEREFLENQEICGMVPVGHFRDLDDPDSFVWIRGFSNMDARLGALECFYVQSPHWLENRDTANATLLDNDNVLLLRNARSNSGFDLQGLERPARGESRAKADSFVAASIFMLDAAANEAFVDAFEREILPLVSSQGERVAYFVTEERPNNFPRLPVRETEFAFVVVALCATRGALDALAHTWHEARLPDLLQDRIVSRETLSLVPAERSLLH